MAHRCRLALAGAAISALSCLVLATTASASSGPRIVSFSQVPQSPLPYGGASVVVTAKLARARTCQLLEVGTLPLRAAAVYEPNPTWSHNPKACTSSDIQTIRVWPNPTAEYAYITFKMVVTGAGSESVSHTFRLVQAPKPVPPTTTTTTVPPTTTTVPSTTTTTTTAPATIVEVFVGAPPAAPAPTAPPATTTTTVPATTTTTSTSPTTTTTAPLSSVTVAWADIKVLSAGNGLLDDYGANPPATVDLIAGDQLQVNAEAFGSLANDPIGAGSLSYTFSPSGPYSLVDLSQSGSTNCSAAYDYLGGASGTCRATFSGPWSGTVSVAYVSTDLNYASADGPTMDVVVGS